MKRKQDANDAMEKSLGSIIWTSLQARHALSYWIKITSNYSRAVAFIKRSEDVIMIFIERTLQSLGINALSRTLLFYFPRRILDSTTFLPFRSLAVNWIADRNSKVYHSECWILAWRRYPWVRGMKHTMHLLSQTRGQQREVLPYSVFCLE